MSINDIKDYIAFLHMYVLFRSSYHKNDNFKIIISLSPPAPWIFCPAYTLLPLKKQNKIGFVVYIFVSYGVTIVRQIRMKYFIWLHQAVPQSPLKLLVSSPCFSNAFWSLSFFFFFFFLLIKSTPIIILTIITKIPVICSDLWKKIKRCKLLA